MPHCPDMAWRALSCTRQPLIRTRMPMALLHILVPVLSLAMLAIGPLLDTFLPTGGLVLRSLMLVFAVLSAVHHAEVVAHRTGEPLGTLVLALAVTVIEVALILSFMLASGADKASLARDTLFAAIMIICNGVVGLCLLVGGWRHTEQRFRVQGIGPAGEESLQCNDLFQADSGGCRAAGIGSGGPLAELHSGC